ncbi:hypothetical protein [Persephonella sp.]
MRFSDVRLYEKWIRKLENGKTKEVIDELKTLTEIRKRRKEENKKYKLISGR